MHFNRSQNIKKSIYFGLPALAILLFFFIKAIQFQFSSESFNDGLLALQLSRGWLEGRPLLFDTFYGNHQLIHNYYFIILLGFLTKTIGVYGLFAGYFLLLAIFFWQFNALPASSLARWWTVFIFTFGPFALFIYLDFYGWHPEQYFLPLLALLALSLARKQHVWSAIWFLLALSVKESAPILLFSLLFFCSVVDLAFTRPGEKKIRYFINPRNFGIAFVCFVLFCISMWWLSNLNAGQSSRIATAFERFVKNSTAETVLLYSCLYVFVGLAIFAIGILPMIPILKSVKEKWVILAALAICYSLLFAIFFIESLYYFPAVKLAISYPPRAGGLWAFLMSACVFLICRIPIDTHLKPVANNSWIWGGLFLQFFTAPFLISHNYPEIPDRQQFHALFSYVSKSSFGLNPYFDGTKLQLHKLAERLPEGAEIIVPHEYISLFQNVYPSEWNEENGKLHLLGRPFIYIYEKRLIGHNARYIFPEKSYVTIPNDQLLILSDSIWYKTNFQ